MAALAKSLRVNLTVLMEKMASCTQANQRERNPDMPRIQASAFASRIGYTQKWRRDGLMLNARWIRNGGAKGVSMTATSA